MEGVEWYKYNGGRSFLFIEEDSARWRSVRKLVNSILYMLEGDLESFKGKVTHRK